MAKVPVAIVGGDSLLGNEVREMLAAAGLPASVKLVGSEDPETVILTERDGEAVVITGLDVAVLHGAKAVFLAGSPVASRKAVRMMGARGSTILIDLSGGLEEEPEARLRAPEVEPPDYDVPAAAIHVVAHPAAILLAMFFRRLHPRLPVRRAVVNILEPASERGRAGLNELQQQTVSLLSFHALNKEVFDAQLGFALLARYGSEAPLPLAAVEQRIERHLATLLALPPPVPMPSLRLIQAPVMHGYSMSVWAEFEGIPTLDSLAEVLQCPEIDVRTGDQEAPNNVDAANQSGQIVGAIDIDRNNAHAAWLWMAADNFRVHAESAVAVARGLLTGELTA